MAFLYSDPLTTNPFQNITITDPDQPDKSVPNYQLKENWDKETFNIVSKVAFLIGVPERFFRDENAPLQEFWFDKLQENKHACIVRSISIVRTNLEQNYAALRERMQYGSSSLTSYPDLVDIDALFLLEQNGIRIGSGKQKTKYRQNQYLMDLNTAMANRINNCKSIFPVWLTWDYIRELFIIPNGQKEEGIREAANLYYANKSDYPYQCFLNWPYEDCGNILYNDRKFVHLIYQVHGEYFDDESKVSDAGVQTKEDIYSFLAESPRTAIVVDCENSDPYKLYATLNNLDQNQLLPRIAKIILYDDVHTTSAWDVLNKFTSIPIEHIEIDRVKEGKSLVDIRLTTGTCREYYVNGIDSFLLVSSDSDYWGLISSMPELKFLVLIEWSKFSGNMKATLQENGVRYCYIDDFCTGNSNEIKIEAVKREVTKYIKEHVNLNVNEMLNQAYTITRADMTDGEKRQFYARFIKPMRLVVSEDGTAEIILGE